MIVDEKTPTASDEPPSNVALETRGQGASSNDPPAYSQAVNLPVNPMPEVQKWRPGHNDPRWNQDQDSNYSNLPLSSPTASTSNNPCLVKAIPATANLVHVFRRDGAIRGEWNINPGLEIPAALLSAPREDNHPGKKRLWGTFPEPTAATDENGEQANLTLHTRDGKIVADVWISDSTELDADVKKKKPTLLDLNTRDGSIALRVRTHGSRPLRIRVHTNDGRIWVWLPRSFNGLVFHDIRDGKLNFSEGMKPHATTFSMVEGRVGTSFIGDWRALNGAEARLETWEGDKCEVSTRDGGVYIYWDDEYEEIMARRKSNWFKYIFQID